MNIHEIVQAWESNSLPTDLDALAAIQNKVDDYSQKSLEGVQKARTKVVFDMYAYQSTCYQMLSAAIEEHTSKCIPDLKPREKQVQ